MVEQHSGFQATGEIILKQITDGTASNDAIFVSGASLIHKDNVGVEHILD